MVESSDIEKSLKIMEVVEKELNERKRSSTICLTFFLVVNSVWILLVALWEQLGKPIEPSVMTYGVEIIAIIMLFVTKNTAHMKFSDMRITKKNLWPSLRRAVLICIGIVALMSLFKLAFIRSETFINWSNFVPLYIFTSILQEFLARGFLLTCLLNIFDSKYKNHMAVFVSSILFTSLHLYYGFTFMVGAGVLSVILGYVCIKDENIWGVSLIHYVFGMTGFLLELV